MTQPEEPLGPNWIIGSDTGRYLQEKAEEPGYLTGEGGGAPVVIGIVSPSEGYPGDEFTIAGTGLDLVQFVKLGDVQLASFELVEDEFGQILVCTVPEELAPGGPYMVEVIYPLDGGPDIGVAEKADAFTVLEPEEE